jgi:hypothetical protein
MFVIRERLYAHSVCTLLMLHLKFIPIIICLWCYECGVQNNQIGRHILQCHNLSWIKQYWAEIILHLKMWNFSQHFVVLSCCYVTVQTNVHTKLTETDVKESIWSTRGPCWAEAIILWVSCHIRKYICRWCESITLHTTRSVYLMQEPATQPEL